VAEGDPTSQRRCRTLGLAPAAVFEIEDRTTSEMHAVSLAGGIDDLFETRRRERNTIAASDIHNDEEHQQEKTT